MIMWYSSRSLLQEENVGLWPLEIFFRLVLTFVSKCQNTGWLHSTFSFSSFARGCEHRGPRDGAHGPSAPRLPPHIHGPRGGARAAPEDSGGSPSQYSIALLWVTRWYDSWRHSLWHSCMLSGRVLWIMHKMYGILSSIISCFPACWMWEVLHKLCF